MQEFINIYSKLIIAITSFIAPLIVYLLSVFGDGLEMLKKLAEEKEEQVTKLLLSNLGRKGKASNSDLIERSNKELKTIKRRNRRRVNILKPKRQINRIFYCLFSSLLLTMIAAVIKDNSLFIKNVHLSHILLAISIILFVSGIIIIRQVAWVIIETKQQLEEIKLTSQKDNDIKPVEILGNPEDINQ